MHITIGDESYELSTKLGTVKKIEEKLKAPMMELFSRLGTAKTDMLLDMLKIAVVGAEQKEFINAAEEHWDYLDLFNAAQDLALGMMFSGTPEENEAKLDKFPVDEETKNVMRGILNLPPKKSEAGIGNE